MFKSIIVPGILLAGFRFAKAWIIFVLIKDAWFSPTKKLGESAAIDKSRFWIKLESAHSQ